MQRTWSDDDIREFVSGKLVRAYTPDSQDVEVPDWILAASAGLRPTSAAECFASAHPDDQHRVVVRYITCCESPGELVSERIRYLVDGVWVVANLEVVNLLAQANVGALLSAWSIQSDGGVDGTGATNRVGDQDSVDWMLAHLDETGHVLHAEGKVGSFLGCSADEVIGRRLTDFFHVHTAAVVVSMWFSMLETPGATRSLRAPFIQPDGTELWAESTALNRFDADGNGDVLLLAYDITERRAQEEALRQSLEEISRLAEDFRSLADEVPAAVFRCDADGVVTFHNTRWDELAGDHPAPRVHDMVHPDDRPLLADELGRLLAAGGKERTTFEARSVTGDRTFAITWRSSGEDEAENRRIVGSIDDVTSNVQLRAEARRDELTGLLNRKALDEMLAAAVESDPEGTLLIFIDLDGFKNVNDVYGHDAGDAVLREVSRRLAFAVRPEDAIGRYGGDEFVIVCREMTAGDVVMVARVHAALAGQITFEGGAWEPAASVGTARPQPGEALTSLMRRADLAMFGSKRERRRRSGALR